jgi:hypothetical protein
MTINTLHEYSFSSEFRGGSQVISIFNNKYYLCIVHEVELSYDNLNRKNATYNHRLILMDSKLKLLTISDKFNFMGSNIEFCNGMCEYNDDLLITFGFQDNASFLLKVNKLKFLSTLLNYEF